MSPAGVATPGGVESPAMFDPDDLEGLGETLRNLDPPLQLTFHHDPDSELSGPLGRGAEALARGAAGGVRLLPDENSPTPPAGGPTPPGIPALTITRPGGGVIHYLALPEGFEAEPFAELLEGRSVQGDPPPGLTELTEPAELLLFIAPTCPHCPNMVRAAAALALASPLVSVSIVDVQRFEELARRYQVTAAPTTIVDGELSLTGLVPSAELVQHLLDRGTDQHGAQVLQSLVNNGLFDQAVDEVTAGSGARPFGALWKKSTTSTRIGLMLLAEKVLQRNRRALDDILGELVAVLGAEDAALRGDTADLIGQTGSEKARPALEKLLADPNLDVVEIAEEALSGLEDAAG